MQEFLNCALMGQVLWIMTSDKAGPGEGVLTSELSTASLSSCSDYDCPGKSPGNSSGAAGDSPGRPRTFARSSPGGASCFLSCPG